MNNREFLFSLSDVELSKYLTCRACFRENIDEEQDKCFGDCESCQVEWLNSGYSQQNNSEELDTIS